jgi:uncharacterized protein (TIGR00299 family) protein
MRIAYIDCVGGASGDMFLGALLSAGAPRAEFDAAIASLGLPGVRVETTRASRHGIGGLAVRVIGGDEADHGHAHHDHDHVKHDPAHQDHARHDHADHDHAHHDQPHHDHSHHRGLTAIEAIIVESALSPWAKEKALLTFRHLAEVEGEIHGVPPERIHFHEVGAIDAIVDVVGTAVAFELLGIERAYHSSIPMGSGETRAAHGVLPIPAPATVALLRGRPVRMSEHRYEMTTPTGAALLATLAGPETPPPMRPISVGYGCGAADPPDVANVLRVVVGESEGALRDETLFLIETNIDDMNPQAVEPLFEQAFAAGALDLFITPIQMKKARPAILVSALVPEGRVTEVSRVLLTETPTLGVRVQPTRRLSLPREERVVETEWGAVRVKVAFLDGRPLRARPEYEDCRRIAREAGLPFLAVYESVLRRLG